MKELAFNLKKIRIHKKYTQKQLAENIGVSRIFVSHIEQGVRKPSLDILEKIALSLDVKVKAFFEDIK